MRRQIITTIHGALQRFFQSNAGGVAMIGAVSLPVLLGGIGLSFDINRGLEQRAMNQRAADVAALGAAMAYRDNGSEDLLQPTANDIVVANRVGDAEVTAAIVEDFPNEGDSSVRVRVTSEVPYTLARVLGFRGEYEVVSESFASLTSQAQFAPPCFLALSTDGDAVTVTGGASINAPDCTVAAFGSIDNKGQLIRGHDIVAGGGSISVNYGTLDAETLRFAGSFNAPAWNNNIPPANKRIHQATTLVDPWATSEELADARADLGSYTPIPALSDPDTSSCPNAKDFPLVWNPNGSNAAKPYWTGSGYSFPAGTYCIKKLTTDGGLTIKFASGSNIFVDKGLAIGGGTNVNFGDSNLYVNGGFDSGSNGVTIGNGTLWIGGGNGANFVKWQGTNYKGDGTVIINHTLKLGGGQNLLMGSGNHFFGGFDLGGGGSAKMGDGDFIAAAGVMIAGGSELAIGDGDVLIGPGNANSAIKLSGSARFFMGDGSFSANGDINTAGGSRIVFGRTNNHYINGSMKIAGSALFGAGRYTINGDFWNGTGGTTWPYTSALNGMTYGAGYSGWDMAGSDVTFVLEGELSLAGGAKTKLTAPTTSIPGGKIAEMLVHSLSSDNTNWTGGSGNNFAGVVYLPNSQVKMAGGNTTLSAGQCFTLIAQKIWATGGAAAGTSCPSMQGESGGASNSIRLVS